MRERRMSLDAGLHVSSVQSWLRQELETRGIDSMVYARYILSILQQDSRDLEAESEVWNAHCVLRRRGRKERRRSYDGEELKKTAAVECLRSATDEDQGIIGLVEETYRKLKEQKFKEEKDVSPPGGGGVQETTNRPVRSSTPKHEKEGYYEAFPALKETTATEPIRPTQDSVWSKRTSPFSFRDDNTRAPDEPVKKRQAPRPYVYYKVGRDAKSKRDSKRRSLKKSSPTKPILRGEEGMKITEDILNLLKVHPENVQVRHPTIRRLTMPTADGDSDEKYLYTGPLDDIFQPRGEKLRLYERVNNSEMFASSEVLELISHDTDSVSRFLPFFVTKKRSRDSLTSDVEEARSLAHLMTSDVEEARSLAHLMNQTNNNLSPCAAEICSIETGFLQDSSDSSSSSLRNTPALISVDQAWVQEVLGDEMARHGDWFGLESDFLFGALTSDMPPLTKPGESLWTRSSNDSQEASVSLTEPLGLNLPRTAVYWPVHETLNGEQADGVVSTPEVVVSEPVPSFQTFSDTDSAEEIDEAKTQDLHDSEQATTVGELKETLRSETLTVDFTATEKPKTPVEPTMERESSSNEPPILSEKSVPRVNEPPRPCCMEQPCLRDISPESSSNGSQGLKSPGNLEIDRNVSPKDPSEPSRSSHGSRESSTESGEVAADSRGVVNNDALEVSSESREISSERDGELGEVSSESGRFSSESREVSSEPREVSSERDGEPVELIELDGVDRTEWRLSSLDGGMEGGVEDRASTPPVEEPELAGLADKEARGSIPDGSVSSTSRLLEIMAEAHRSRLGSITGAEQLSPSSASEPDVTETVMSVKDVLAAMVTTSSSSRTVSDDDSSDGCEDDEEEDRHVCQICHGVVCVCYDMPLSRRHHEIPLARQYDVIDALRHNDVIRLRSQDSFTSEASYVSLIDFFDRRDSSTSPNDLTTTNDEEIDLAEPDREAMTDATPPSTPGQLSYVIDEKARVSFESHESSSASDSGNEYLLKDDMAEDIDTVLAELNIPQEALAYEECDDVFSHPSFDDPLDTSAWEVPLPYEEAKEHEDLTTSTHQNLYPLDTAYDSSSCYNEDLAVDESPHDLLWLFDLCNLHHIYSELDRQESPNTLLEAGAYLGEMGTLLQDDNNLAAALQALAYDSECESIIGHLNRLLQSQFEEFEDLRWSFRDSKPLRRSSCGNLKLLDRPRERVLLPSDSSAFKDKIPSKLPRELPHSHSDSSLFMKLAPIIKVQTRSEDDAAESTELFSPETHFRPILAETEKARRSYDILTKPDIYNNVYPSDMTQEYQEYKEAETDFVPKFRVSETQNKGLQTDIKVRKRRRAYTEACLHTCRELIASYKKEQVTKSLSVVLPLSELCSRVVYQRNAALFKSQMSSSRSSSPRSSDSGQTMIERDDLDLEEVFAAALTLKANSEQQVSQESENHIETDEWEHWSGGDIWSSGVADHVAVKPTDDWSLYLAGTLLADQDVYDDDVLPDYDDVALDYDEDDDDDDVADVTEETTGSLTEYAAAVDAVTVTDVVKDYDGAVLELTPCPPGDQAPELSRQPRNQEARLPPCQPGDQVQGPPCQPRDQEQLPPRPPGDEAPFSSELEEQWLMQGFDQMELMSSDAKQRKRPRSGSWSTRPCTFFMEGSCRRSDCRFSHDLSTITCRFWLKGECFKGVTCPFMHGYVKESPPCVKSPVDRASPAPSTHTTTTAAKEQVFPPCLKDQADFPPISACVKASSASHRKLTHNQKRRSKSRSSSRDDG